MKMKMLLFGWLAGALAVNAGTLERTQAWAENAGAEVALRVLGSLGIRDEAVAGAILESWDERLVVDKALEADSVALLARVLGRDRLSAESVQRVLAHEQAKTEPSRATWQFVRSLPREQQEDFEEMMVRLVPVIFHGRPVAAELALKYEVRQGLTTVSAESETGDLARLLLAPEPLDLASSERLKGTIKNQAVRMARHYLREQGRSFVVQDGVNPLTEAVRPVVDALNAPLCEGLEAALRGLGAEVANIDRVRLQELAAQWREEVMLGDMSSWGTGGILGRLSVALGVEAFNAFVEEYNHGSGDAGREQR